MVLMGNSGSRVDPAPGAGSDSYLAIATDVKATLAQSR
jgi:hypothetical protein